jgi:hypothetical protein
MFGAAVGYVDRITVDCSDEKGRPGPLGARAGLIFAPPVFRILVFRISVFRTSGFGPRGKAFLPQKAN